MQNVKSLLLWKTHGNFYSKDWVFHLAKCPSNRGFKTTLCYLILTKLECQLDTECLPSNLTFSLNQLALSSNPGSQSILILSTQRVLLLGLFCCFFCLSWRLNPGPHACWVELLPCLVFGLSPSESVISQKNSLGRCSRWGFCCCCQSKCSV